MEEAIEDKLKLSASELDDILSNTSTKPTEGKPSAQFNYNKLQAVICILLSAVVSIAFLVWIFS